MDGVRACGGDISLVRNALVCEAVTVGQTAVDRLVLSCQRDGVTSTLDLVFSLVCL